MNKHAVGFFSISLVGVLLGDAGPLGRAAADSPATIGGEHRWRVVGVGVVQDLRSRQQWLQQDNGKDIDWNHAKSHCDSRHHGWRLPDVEELESLYDPRAVAVRCEKSICKIPPHFRLTGSWFWSATQVGEDSSDGNELAWGVLMVNGSKTQAVRDAGFGSRVLCVRNAKPA